MINQNEEKTFESKLLKAILITLLENKPRETRVKILKNVGFNKFEILDFCGPSDITLRTRKYRGKK